MIAGRVRRVAAQPGPDGALDHPLAETPLPRRRAMAHTDHAGPTGKAAGELPGASPGVDLRDSARSLPRHQSPVIIATKDRQRISALMGWIGDQGHPVVLADALAEMEYRVHAARCGCLIVDIDTFDDLVRAIDVLVQLREQRPNLMVILLSEQVRRDDFSLERLPLCDVTLRYPLEPADLAFALEEAAVNNRVWIWRRRSFRLNAAPGLWPDSLPGPG